jgi:hypothetical protein
VVFSGDTAVSARWWRKKWRAGFVAGVGGEWQIVRFDGWSNTPPAPCPYFFEM